MPQEVSKGQHGSLPRKTGKRREGPYSEQNPRGTPKGSGRADQDHGKGALGGPHEGGTGDLPGKPSRQGLTVTTPATS